MVFGDEQKFYAWNFFSSEKRGLTNCVAAYALTKSEKGYSSIEEAAESAENWLIANFPSRKKDFEAKAVDEDPYKDGFFIVNEEVHKEILHDWKQDSFYLDPFLVSRTVSVKQLVEVGRIAE